MGFYVLNDSTNSAITPKEDKVLRIRLQSHQVRPMVLQ